MSMLAYGNLDIGYYIISTSQDQLPAPSHSWSLLLDIQAQEHHAATI